MQTSVNQRKIFKEPRKSKYFSIMTTFYRSIQVLCCLDFGFFENKSKRTIILWKSITVFYLISIVCICFYCTFIDNSRTEFNNYIIPGFIFYFIRFLVNVIYLVFFNPNNKFCQFHRDLEYVDKKLGVENASYNIEVKILACIVCNTVFFCTLGLLTFAPDSMRLGLICSIIVMMTTSDSVVVVTCAFVFYSINCRLKTFTSILRNGKTGIYSMQLIYRLIADLTEAYKSAFDALVS